MSNLYEELIKNETKKNSESDEFTWETINKIRISLDNRIKESIENKKQEAAIVTLDYIEDNWDLMVFKSNLNRLSEYCHGVNVKAGWWTDIKTGESLEGKRNIGELLCLIHSEISEAMEGYRKNLMDDKLPHRKMIEVELADALIRIFDLAGSMNLDLGGALVEKIQYNKKREDHKIENRLKDQGKKF